MAKSGAAKGCICFGIVLLLVSGGVLAWYFVANDDTNSNSVSIGNNNNNNNNNNDNDNGGLFGTGLFGKKNETTSDNNNGNNNNHNNPSTPSSGKMTTSSPTIAPTTNMPTETRYTFNQCSNTADASFTTATNTDANTNTTAAATTTNCCNGLNNICNIPVNNILFAGVHNGHVTEDKFLVPNHKQSISYALEAGYRGINLDVCNCNGIYTLCHGFCGLGEANVMETVSYIIDFLTTNTNEIIVLTLELNSEAGENVDLNDFYNTILKQIDNFDNYLYFHGIKNENNWPTLENLIVNNTRLLAFHFNGPTCLEEDGYECPTGLHYYFSYFQETEFDFENVVDILDTETSCPITRGATSSTGAFLGINNFVTPGFFDIGAGDTQIEAAETVNAYDFAINRIRNCEQIIQDGIYYGDDDANIIWVDFWSIGDIVQVVQEHNQNLLPISDEESN